MLHQHLRAETDAEKRSALLQRHADPVGLLAHEVVRIVGAHRPAEDDRAGMLLHRLRQRVAEARLADVELEALRRQHLPKLSRARMLLVENNQDLVGSGSGGHVGKMAGFFHRFNERISRHLHRRRVYFLQRAAFMAIRSRRLTPRSSATRHTRFSSNSWLSPSANAISQRFSMTRIRSSSLIRRLSTLVKR